MIDATCRSSTRSLQKENRIYPGPKIGATNLEAGPLILVLWPHFWVQNPAPVLGPQNTNRSYPILAASLPLPLQADSSAYPWYCTCIQIVNCPGTSSGNNLSLTMVNPLPSFWHRWWHISICEALGGRAHNGWGPRSNDFLQSQVPRRQKHVMSCLRQTCFLAYLDIFRKCGARNAQNRHSQHLRRSSSRKPLLERLISANSCTHLHVSIWVFSDWGYKTCPRPQSGERCWCSCHGKETDSKEREETTTQG